MPPGRHLKIPRHRAFTQVTQWLIVTGVTLAQGSQTNTLLLHKSPFKQTNNHQVRQSFTPLCEEGTKLGSGGCSLRPLAVAAVSLLRMADGRSVARRLPGASFAAGRWKVSTPMDGGEAPGTSLSSASPRPPQIEPQIAPDPRSSQSAERVACSCFFSFFFSQGAKFRGRELAVPETFLAPRQPWQKWSRGDPQRAPFSDSQGMGRSPPAQAWVRRPPAHTEEVVSPQVPDPGRGPSDKENGTSPFPAPHRALGASEAWAASCSGRELSGRPQG